MKLSSGVPDPVTVEKKAYRYLLFGRVPTVSGFDVKVQHRTGKTWGRVFDIEVDDIPLGDWQRLILRWRKEYG